MGIILWNAVYRHVLYRLYTISVQVTALSQLTNMRETGLDLLPITSVWLKLIRVRMMGVWVIHE